MPSGPSCSSSWAHPAPETLHGVINRKGGSEEPPFLSRCAGYFFNAGFMFATLWIVPVVAVPLETIKVIVMVPVFVTHTLPKSARA